MTFVGRETHAPIMKPVITNSVSIAHGFIIAWRVLGCLRAHSLKILSYRVIMLGLVRCLFVCFQWVATDVWQEKEKR